MTRYVVEAPVAQSQTTLTSSGKGISYDPLASLREASQLRQLVREFQKQNPGTVELIDPDETNTTVEIEATAQAAESLRHAPGIGKVEEQKRHEVHYHRGPGQ